MKGRTLLVLALVFTAGTSGWCQAPKPSLNFGTMRLTLGMPEVKVLEWAAATYKTVKFEDMWILLSKGEESSTQLRRGELIFKDGRLFAAKKEWLLQYTPTAEDFFDAAQGAAKHLQEEGSTKCALETREESVNEPDIHTSTAGIHLLCGQKSVILRTWAISGKGRALQVWEVLSPDGTWR